MKTSRKQRDKLLKNLSRALVVSTPLVVAGLGVAGSASARGNCPAGSHLDNEGYCMVDNSAPVSTGISYSSRTQQTVTKAAPASSYVAYSSTRVAQSEAAPRTTIARVAQAEAPKAEAEAEGAVRKAKAEAEAPVVKAKAEAEAEAPTQKAKGEAEAEAKGEGEAEAKGEAEAEAKGDASHIVRPRKSAKYRGMGKAALIARGKELYADETLSTNGLACNSCHGELEGYNATFKKRYPHYVAMGKDIYGQRKISAETMVQLCMEQPMEASPLPWDSEKLAALTAYVKVVRKEYKASGKWKGAAEGEGEGEAKGEAEH